MAGSWEVQFAGGKTGGRTKVEQKDFREKVLPEQGLENKYEFARKPEGKIQATDWEGRGVT